MTKPFDTIQRLMDENLEQVNPELPAARRRSQNALLIGEKIAEVQSLGKKWINCRDREIVYFRKVGRIIFLAG